MKTFMIHILHKILGWSYQRTRWACGTHGRAEKCIDLQNYGLKTWKNLEVRHRLEYHI